MLKIYSSKKLLILNLAFGTCLLFLSVIFLYSNSVAPQTFLKWAGILSLTSGAFIITFGSLLRARPIISASGGGLWLDVSIYFKRVFVPWNVIHQINSEKMGAMSGRPYSKTDCLVIEMKPSFRMPKILRRAYLKVENKIYFAALSLSVPVDEAVHQLNSLMRNN